MRYSSTQPKRSLSERQPRARIYSWSDTDEESEYMGMLVLLTQLHGLDEIKSRFFHSGMALIMHTRSNYVDILTYYLLIGWIDLANFEIFD